MYILYINTPNTPITLHVVCRDCCTRHTYVICRHAEKRVLAIRCIRYRTKHCTRLDTPTFAYPETNINDDLKRRGKTLLPEGKEGHSERVHSNQMSLAERPTKRRRTREPVLPPPRDPDAATVVPEGLAASMLDRANARILQSVGYTGATRVAQESLRALAENCKGLTFPHSFLSPLPSFPQQALPCILVWMRGTIANTNS